MLSCWLRFNPSQVQFTLGKQGIYATFGNLFQSLTGSIHTLRLLKYFEPCIKVSIPHRFNSHFYMGSKGGLLFWVSIPHRFNSHGRTLRLFDFYIDPFQSLTGSIHTYDPQQGVVLEMSFNPSQVQFTQLWRKNSPKGMGAFQSLTGSIHTRQK